MNLIPVGSRVKCGDRHRGTLLAYFTAVRKPITFLDYSGDETTELYGVIDLDGAQYGYNDDYRCQNDTFITMLVVHIDNLEEE